MTHPTFPALGLAEPLLRALEARKFLVPTPIQADSIPALLDGKDLLGIAQTGSGKTAAFTLPMLQHLAAHHVRPAPFVTRALILAPTRELALQIDETARALSQHVRLRTVVIIGGASRFKQVEAMRRGADIVIGTPGRVCDLMQTRELQLGAVTHFVLDEADRMLDLGFIKDIRRIVSALPPRRQSCLFSATMPNEVAGLANSLLRDPVRVEIARKEETAPKIEQFVHHLAQSGKQSLLLSMLGDDALSRVIVFTRTKHGANKVAGVLENAGIQVNAIHGNKSQPQREKALREFRTGRARVLVATDIAARGIDVTGVSHVINFDLPAEPESYVHRIGRTARAGAAGVAISFCDPSERGTLRQIERQMKQTIAVVGEAPPPMAHQPKRPSAPGQAKRRRANDRNRSMRSAA
ncbi:DEAD/DEAH box helicase [Rhodopila globiformis]|uniref:DEAD/DEAH box helicase n=1 Tax=Rhodopila globiformis TaxID=1071 RepID=A0A2S6NNY8_RHOGL|nr:DEAD/DEAH box helicase [Rhodopila globiformis]PPQ39261.1 DEAD/DEAH box helicase [Rhodopila globiformis]